MLNNLLTSTAGARQVYTRGFLTIELPRLAQSLSEDDFTKFQCERLRAIMPCFASDTLSVSAVLYDKDGQFSRASYVGRYRVAQDVYKKYLEFQQYDQMMHLNQLFRGCAVFSTDVMSMEAWQDHVFFNGFLRPTGRHHSVILSYAYPFKRDLELRFNFQTNHPNTFGPDLTKDLVEHLNLPFFFAWLLRLNVIDEQMLAHWLSMLVELSPFEVMLLRKLSAPSGFAIQEAADALLSDRARVEETLFAVSGSTKGTPIGTSVDTSFEWLLNLGMRYSFLRHAGDCIPQHALAPRIAATLAVAANDRAYRTA